MKKERIRKLANIIEAGTKELGFDMSDYKGEREGCGTVACIAGWAVAVFKPEVFRSARAPFDFHGSAQDLLGLPDGLANQLFHPDTSLFWSEITPTIAADTLRKLADTGEVVWP